MDRMRRFKRLLVSLGWLVSVANPGVCQVAETVSEPLRRNQYDLQTEGRAFLLKEAAGASLFMLGELHGENEIPRLIQELWPPMWQAGYRHIAAEISPWAANRLEFRPQSGAAPAGLWSQAEATFVASFNKDRNSVLWGCDMEEAQPHLLLRDFAASRPKSRVPGRRSWPDS